MAWPGKIYVATKDIGVYFTDDFHNPGIQPAWRAINTGLGDLHCLEFHVDPFHDEDRQYVLTYQTSDNTLYKREYEGSWVAILTPAGVDTLTGGTSGAINGFCADPSVDGRLWVALTWWIGGTGWIGTAYSDDWGATWHEATPVYSGGMVYGCWSVRACGDNVWLYESCTAGADSYIDASQDKMVTSHWTINVQWQELNPLYPNWVYNNHASKLAKQTNANVLTDLINTPYAVKYGMMWFDPVDPLHQRMIYNNRLYVTTDGWATTNSPSAITGNPDNIAPPVSTDTDQMLLGLTFGDHCIGTINGEGDTSPTGIAGISPGVPPYTDSIPGNSGVCWCGIYGVPRGKGKIFTNAVEMYGYSDTGTERGTPMAGDRSAWDALNYPLRHTDDINDPDGIHWTYDELEVLIAAGGTGGASLPASAIWPIGINLLKVGIVLTRGSPGAWDDDCLDGASVIWDTKQQQYRMTYVGYDGATQRIGLAWSIDLINWTKDASNPIFEPSGVGGDPDENGVAGGYLYQEGDTYYLFYIGCTLPGYEQGLKTTCLATSTDLIAWTRHGTVIPTVPATWRAGHTYRPSIIKKDSTYYMFFNATAVDGGVEKTGYATSPDLLTWTVDDVNSPIISNGGGGDWDKYCAGDPWVWRANGYWYVAYYGADDNFSQDGLAFTSDADFPTGWVKHPLNPLLTCTPASYDSRLAHKPSIFITPGCLYHYYVCSTAMATTGWDIALAVELIPKHSDHDHSASNGEGGTFDAANLTSGASGDGDVLTSDGVGGAAWEAPSGGSLALDDLTDVNAPAPNDQDVLTWDDGAGEWIAQAPAVGGGHYRQFLYTLDGAGDFIFLTDVDGNPLTALMDLE